MIPIQHESPGGDPNIRVAVLTVTDLHQNKNLYGELVKAVEKHKPDVVALVGDFLHAGEDFQGRLPVADCAEVIASLPCENIIFTRGNHEDENWLEFVRLWPEKRRLNALNGEVFQHGPLFIVGFPCFMGDEKYFLGKREALNGATEWLIPLLRTHGPAARTLWLMHETPLGTPLSAPWSIVEGNGFWNEAIEYAKPLLAISGHDHVTPIRKKCWHHKIGSTTCVNVGQTGFGLLRYCLIKAVFPSPHPGVPETMTVTAYPNGETIQLVSK